MKVATIDCLVSPTNPVERIRKVPVFGPLGSSMLAIGPGPPGSSVSHSDWPVAGNSSIA